LQTRFSSADGRDKSLLLEDFCQKKPTPIQRAGLQKFTQELMLLTADANPILRSIIQDYQHLVAQLALGKNHSVAARLTKLKTLRAKVSARMSEIDDYLNWFEATQLKTPSGAFADYLRAAGDGRDRPSRRHDPLSVYLDALEEQF
jgi:hypothetical protein